MFFNEVYFGAQLTVLNSDKLRVCQVFKFLTSDTAHSLCDVHVNLKQCDLLVTVDGFRYVSISRSTGQGDHRPVRHVHPCLCCLWGTQSENTYRWLLTCWSRNSGRHNYNRSKLKKVGKYLPFFSSSPSCWLVWGKLFFVVAVVNFFGFLLPYWEIQQSWFAGVNALCNLLRKTLWEVTAHSRPISEEVLLHAGYNSGSCT